MRHLKPMVVAIVVIALVATVAWAATVKIVVEGEDYVSIKPSMVKATSAQASGKAYVHVPLRRPHATTETGPADDGNCVYKIKVPSAGTYQLWALMHFNDGCANSIFTKVDALPSTYITDATYGRWHWVKGAKYTLTAGTHTVRMQYREDGVKLDQFMLINNTRYVPTKAEARTSQYIIK